jgi:polygalacturonase
MIKYKFVKFAFCFAAMLLLFFSCASKKDNANTDKISDNWLKMQAIIDEVKVPVFKNNNYSVNDFGAVADGVFNNSKAFEKAIKICSDNGGGTVSVPKGNYFTGPIQLEDNVNFHLEDGAEILFSTNPNDYPLVHTSFEGTEVMNYCPLIYAYNKKNIAITGKGILNGQANETNWWPWKGSDSEGHTYGFVKGQPSQKDKLNLPALMDMAQNDEPVEKRIFGEGHYLRPNFIEPFGCTNVLIKEVKVVNAPFWILHPIKSTNITVDGVTIESHGPNNDGCDPEYSKNVIIKNCTFNTGDDCIAIKAGRDNEGRKVAIKCENIIVQNCKMIDGHGGVVIGSEMSAGVQNVFVENCEMDSPNLDRVIRIKSNSKRGGIVDGVYVRNIKVGQIKEAVLKIDMFYDVYGAQTGNFIPKVKNIFLENITVKNSGKFAVWAKGHESDPIENIVLKNVTIDKVQTNYFIENVKNIQFINTKINGITIQNPN